jgi:hypothetical protein
MLQLKTMEFATRSDDVSNDSETTDDDSAAYPERIEAGEVYDFHVQAERGIQMTMQGLPDFEGDSYVSYNDYVDESPLARDGLFHYQAKKAIKQGLDPAEVNGLPDDFEVPELPEGFDLREYREAFPEPEFEHHVIDANDEEYPVPDGYFEDRGAILMPEAIEFEKHDDGRVKVWDDATDGGEVSPEDATDAMTDGHKVGDALAGRAYNALIDNGYKVVKDE